MSDSQAVKITKGYHGELNKAEVVQKFEQVKALLQQIQEAEFVAAKLAADECSYYKMNLQTAFCVEYNTASAASGVAGGLLSELRRLTARHVG